MAIKYVDQFDFKDKTVIARFDFNVPIKNGSIQDTSRIDEALLTINHLLSSGVKKLVLMSHLGRPKSFEDTQYSLEPVGNYLAKVLETDVILSHSCIDNGIKTLLGLSTTRIVLLENLRFHPEEEKNSDDFAQALASYADYFVFDAFGAAHRKHASTYAIQKYFPQKCFAGFLIKKEVEALDHILNKPAKPFVAVVGGAKISDKIKTLKKLLVLCDSILVGGAMAYPFLKAKDIEIGKSLCADADVSIAKELLMEDRSHKIQLPIDHITDETRESKDVIGVNEMGFDIGEKSVEKYSQVLANAKTVFWNGPMGFFEKEAFAQGTFKIANAIAKSSAYSLVGGGDSVNAVHDSGLADEFSHLSTGGGASLEYIEQGSLPAIQALKFGIS